MLDEHLFKAADIVFDLFLNAEINPDELEKEKKVVLQEIRMTEDTPDDYINDLFAEAFFRNTTLGISTLGTVEHVGSFGRQSIIDFMNTSYSPGFHHCSRGGQPRSSGIGGFHHAAVRRDESEARPLR